MNNAEESIRQLLTDVTFDESYRREHRDQVRERALLAFDEVAAASAPRTLSADNATQRTFTQRRALRLGLAMAIAASLVGVLAAWYGPFTRSTNALSDLAVAQDQAIDQADEKFVASLNRLNDFEGGEHPAVLDLGIEACVSEHYYELALASQGSVGARAQPN